jgi:putative endonuclease
MNTKTTGILGEKLAQEFLKARGYQIVAKNYRSPDGEIDIIASKDGVIVFVEVRAKHSPIFGTPEESITRRKKKKLVLVSQHYLQTLTEPPPFWSIDFIGIEINRLGMAVRIEQIENAVGEE